MAGFGGIDACVLLLLLGLKRLGSEVLVSPAPKRRCVLSEEREEGEGEEDTPSDSQLGLFEGLSFLLTMRSKEDKHFGIDCYTHTHARTHAHTHAHTHTLYMQPHHQMNRSTRSELRPRSVPEWDVSSTVPQSRESVSIPFHILVRFQNFDSLIPQVMDSKCFVVSDGYCRTRKYLMGLALGLPCVSYGWIRECIEKVCVCIFVNLSRKFNVDSMASLAFVVCNKMHVKVCIWLSI